MAGRSAADRVFLLPASLLDLTGVVSHTLFLRGTLDAIGAEPDFLRIGAYKTAPNQFTERTFTPDHREMAEWLTTDLHTHVVRGIAEGRGRDRDGGPRAPPRGKAPSPRHRGRRTGTEHRDTRAAGARRTQGVAGGRSGAVVIVHVDAGAVTVDTTAPRRGRQRLHHDSALRPGLGSLRSPLPPHSPAVRRNADARNPLARDSSMCSCRWVRPMS